jgi:hypothetical protein
MSSANFFFWKRKVRPAGPPPPGPPAFARLAGGSAASASAVAAAASDPHAETSRPGSTLAYQRDQTVFGLRFLQTGARPKLGLDQCCAGRLGHAQAQAWPPER